MTKTNGATETIEAVREVWTRKRAKAHAAVTSKHGQCMQAVKDSAEGKISYEQEAQWLREKGEPALAKAQWELKRVEAAIDQTDISPLVNGYLGEATNRIIALLTEAVAINQENEQFVTALRQMNIPSRSSVVIPDLTNIWLTHIRERVARALAPQPTAGVLYQRPPARQPNYEPAPFVAIVGVAAQVAARD